MNMIKNLKDRKGSGRMAKFIQLYYTEEELMEKQRMEVEDYKILEDPELNNMKKEKKKKKIEMKSVINRSKVKLQKQQNNLQSQFSSLKE